MLACEGLLAFPCIEWHATLCHPTWQVTLCSTKTSYCKQLYTRLNHNQLAVVLLQQFSAAVVCHGGNCDLSAVQVQYR